MKMLNIDNTDAGLGSGEHLDCFLVFSVHKLI